MNFRKPAPPVHRYRCVEPRVGQQILSLREESLDADLREELRDHLEICRHCQGLLELEDALRDTSDLAPLRRPDGGRRRAHVDLQLHDVPARHLRLRCAEHGLHRERQCRGQHGALLHRGQPWIRLLPGRWGHLRPAFPQPGFPADEVLSIHPGPRSSRVPRARQLPAASLRRRRNRYENRRAAKPGDETPLLHRQGSRRLAARPARVRGTRLSRALARRRSGVPRGERQDHLSPRRRERHGHDTPALRHRGGGQSGFERPGRRSRLSHLRGRVRRTAAGWGSR